MTSYNGADVESDRQALNNATADLVAQASRAVTREQRGRCLYALRQAESIIQAAVNTVFVIHDEAEKVTSWK
jgi:hypothetical protein